MYTFDTDVLIYSLWQNPPPNHQDRVERAKYAVERILEAGEPIILTAPVLSEFLGVTDPSRMEWYKQIQDGVEFYGMNQASAYVSAQIYADMKKRGQVPKPTEGKAVVKTDIFIAGIAIVNNIPLLTNDNGYKEIKRSCEIEDLNFDVRFLENEPLPPMEDQTTLFDT